MSPTSRSTGNDALPDALTDRLFDDTSWLVDGSRLFADGPDPSLHSVVVPDDALLRFAREPGPPDPGHSPVPVTAMITGGAGGLVALAGRRVEGVEIVAVEAMLRDLGDLAGAAARVIMAADSLEESVEVCVGLPAVPGWERAVESIEAAGRTALVGLTDGPLVLARQLVVLIDADLPFKIMSGPSRGEPVSAAAAVAAVQALIEDADPTDAAELIRRTDRLPDTVEATRVRRRLRRIDRSTARVAG